MFVKILGQMAEGNAVILVPSPREVTTQVAADILNVSRPYFIEILDKDKISYRKVGNRRKILLKDVQNYKDKIDKERIKSLQKLTDQAQDLDMGY